MSKCSTFLILKVWSLGWQLKHFLGACWKCSISGPTEMFWIKICISTGDPSDLYHIKVWDSSTWILFQMDMLSPWGRGPSFYLAAFVLKPELPLYNIRSAFPASKKGVREREGTLFVIMTRPEALDITTVNIPLNRM